MIDVTCAIIFQDHKILAVQRGPETGHPFQWEFPGGKTNEHETPEECIKREIREELSVEIMILRHLNAIEHDYANKQKRLLPFFCTIASGKIILTEHIAFRWLEKAELVDLDWSEADRILIEKNSDFFNTL